MNLVFAPSNRFAYIEFADKESVRTAMALDESLFRGRQIKVRVIIFSESLYLCQFCVLVIKKYPLFGDYTHIHFLAVFQISIFQSFSSNTRHNFYIEENHS